MLRSVLEAHNERTTTLSQKNAQPARPIPLKSFRLRRSDPGVFLNRTVVNEARLADEDRQNDAIPSADQVHRAQCVRIDEGDVV